MAIFARDATSANNARSDSNESSALPINRIALRLLLPSLTAIVLGLAIVLAV